MARLQGKCALVTGAARGIGLAITQAFVEQGACVHLSDINDEVGSAEARRLGCAYHRLDVRREEDWVRVTDLIGGVIGGTNSGSGGLHIVVNNAGVTGFEGDGPMVLQDPEHASLEIWREVHATNLEGVFLGCKHALRVMRRNPAGATGSIINIGSRSGVVGIPRAVAYASSKAAIRNHTKSVALYAAEEGLPVRCNVIQPAAILTPMWEPLLGEGAQREAALAEYSKGTPLARFGTPAEVAWLAVYLGSDESSYTTGAEFTVDGGMLAGVAEPPRPVRRAMGNGQ